MYKVFWADIGKAIHNPDIGKRPVVSVGTNGDDLVVYKVTSRNKDKHFYAHMNNYIIFGFCDCSTEYHINKKYILGYVRDCTKDEHDNIVQKVNQLKGENHHEICKQKNR